jgi:hypothetical protein
VGFCVRTLHLAPEFGKSEGRTTDPSTTLRSGRDDNSSWKVYLAFPNKIVIPIGAQRVGGICGAPLGLPEFWLILAVPTLFWSQSF